MKRYFKIFILPILAMMLCSCEKHEYNQTVDINLGITDNAMRFKVVNLSNPDEYSNFAISSNVKVSVSVNNSEPTTPGEMTVAPGDEIEVVFIPEYAEQQEARFVMPDGTEHVVQSNAPAFRWTVPDDFNKEAEIKGSSSYEKKGVKATTNGTVLLKPGRMK